MHIQCLHKSHNISNLHKTQAIHRVVNIMGKSSAIASLIVVLALVANLMVEQGEALSCGDLSGPMAQCASYASGASSQPSGGCCSAVKQINAMAKTTQDRRQVCSCLKQAASSYPNVQLANIAAIPNKCGVPSVSINPNVDCNS